MLHLMVINCHKGIRTAYMHYFKMFDYLETLPTVKTITFPEIANKSEDQMRTVFIEKFGKMPDNIVFVEHLTELKSINIPSEINIFMLIDDLHHQGSIKINRLAGLKKVSRILSTYGYAFHKYYPIGVPVYFFPHAATFDIGFNDNPINKILISGRLNKDIYPFRQYLVDMCKKNNSLQYLKPNCNYEIQTDSDNLIYGERYIQQLHKYLACFTCDASADRPYIVAKYFEILSSGSLLLAGNPNTLHYFEKLGFVNGVHYIAATMDNIQAKIEFICNPVNRPTIDQIRMRGYEFAKQNHTFVNRAKYLIDILENNDNNIIQCTDGINSTVYAMEQFIHLTT